MFVFFKSYKKEKMSSQSTKERKAKENLLDITFDRSIRGGMCLVSKVPFIIFYDLKCLLIE